MHAQTDLTLSAMHKLTKLMHTYSVSRQQDFAQPMLVPQDHTTRTTFNRYLPYNTRVSNQDRSHPPKSKLLSTVYYPIKTIHNKLTEPVQYSEVLDEQMSFNNFIVTEGNLYAYQMLQSLAGLPGMTILAGGSCSGKTHLAHAVASRTRASGSRVCYLTYPTYRHILGVSEAGLPKVVSILAGNDLLIFDDLHYCIEEHRVILQTIIEYLQYSYAKIMICLRAMQPEVDLLQAELQLPAGMVLYLPEPEYMVTYELLRQSYPSLTSFTLSELAIQCAGTSIMTVGQKITSLTKIQHKYAIDLDIDTIASMAARYFGVKTIDLLLPNRERNIVRMRQIIMYICRVCFRYNLHNIRTVFGYQDHTGVMYAIQRVRYAIANDMIYANTVFMLQRNLQRSLTICRGSSL